MWWWFNVLGVGLEGRRELRPVLGDWAENEIARRWRPERTRTGREALWWCLGLVWIGSSSLTSSLTVFLVSINRLSGGLNEHIVLK